MDKRDYSHWPSYVRQDFDRVVLVVHDREEFPAEFAVCPTCDGRGKYVNPNIDRRGLIAEDFERDPGFVEQYVAGLYDTICRSCKGRRVILVPCSPHGQRVLQTILSDEADHRAEVAAEQRMGA